MPIVIENKADSGMGRPQKAHHIWPWLLSLGLHGGMLVALLWGLGFALPAASPFYSVNLLPIAGNTNHGQSATPPAQAASALVRPAGNEAPPASLNITSPATRTPNPRPAGAGNHAARQPLDPRHDSSGTAGASVAQTGASHNPFPGSGPYTIEQVDLKPQLIHSVTPVYPQAARRRGIEGWVEVRFLVNRQGVVSQEKVLQAQPSGVFNNSALSALRAWRFQPGTLQGRKVDTWVVQIIRFQLTTSG